VSMPDSILIAGSGALATLFAARLSAAGNPVTMFGTWSQGLTALKAHGAILVRPDGSEVAHPVHVLAETPAVKFQHALVLVKSWQTERVAVQLGEFLDRDGLAITLQNGLGNRQILSSLLGAERVAQGVTTLGATLLAPGKVRLGGDGPLSLEVHPRLDALAGLLERAGFQVHLVPDANSLIWGKLVINSAINPLTAILRLKNGELLQNPAAKRLMANLALETATLAARQGISLPFPDPVAAVEEVARLTADNLSSMLQDVMRSAPTEIDAICGAIHNLGDSLGFPTPYNGCMYRLVQAISPS